MITLSFHDNEIKLIYAYSACGQNIVEDEPVDLSHLRRFAKPNQLPTYLQPPGLSRPRSAASIDSTVSNSSSNGSKTSSGSRSRMRRRRSNASTTINLLVGPSAAVSERDLAILMFKQPCFAVEQFPLRIREITVPLLAPTSTEQAQQWTLQFWPTLYRRSNPFGPHPSLVSRSEDEIRSNVTKFINQARNVAKQTFNDDHGLEIGCVVVERKSDGSSEVIAVAGDARRSGLKDDNGVCSGNVACHAVLRAIGMVARKRLRLASPRVPRNNQDNSDIMPGELLVRPVLHVANTPESVTQSLLDYPINSQEQLPFEKDNLTPDGYLCVDLEMYLTHEPCLMCSMAIVHSRFSRCIFGKRMLKSGGMSGDSGLEYCLFWRAELNWKLLCWDYKPFLGEECAELNEETQV